MFLKLLSLLSALVVAFDTVSVVHHFIPLPPLGLSNSQCLKSKLNLDLATVPEYY